jgi:hypothetical protein
MHLSYALQKLSFIETTQAANDVVEYQIEELDQII